MTTQWKTVSVLTNAQRMELCDLLQGSEVVSFDLETQSNSPDKRGNLQEWHPHSRVTSASFTVDSLPDTGFVVPLSHRDGPWGKQWRTVLQLLALSMRGPKLVGHNLKYDARWVLSTTGVDVSPYLWWDTLVGASLLDENAHSNSLKACAADLMGGDWAGVDLGDSESAPWYDLAEYNAGDTVAALRLQQLQRERLGPLTKVFSVISMPALRPITRMETRGLLMDRGRVEEAIEAASWEVSSAEKILLDMAKDYGMDPEETHTVGVRKPRVVPVWDVSWHSTSKWCREFYARAVDAGHLEMTRFSQKTGAPSFNKAALKEQIDTAPAAQALLNFRHGDKQLSYLKDWVNKADSEGRLHPTFNVARAGIGTDDAEGGTVTGRLSSTGPNAQQIAKELKPCFFSPPGFLTVQLDYSQMELRIGAEMVERCPIWDGPNPMAEAYNRGEDLHVVMASIASGLPIEQITAELRQRGKAGNFGFIFSMQAEGFVTYAKDNYGVEMTIDEAAAIRQAFFDTWLGVDHWHAYAVADAHANGYAENIFGRRRHLPDLTSSNWSFKSKAERQAINAPVQSAASDIMLMALADLGQMEEIGLAATVHDSVVLEVPQDGHEQLVEQAARTMLAPSRLTNYFPPLSVPLEVEAEIGQRWGEPDSVLTFQ